ncbi:MAG: hypothetical protein M1834_006759 [Cirrosporium novae-zelandiae]|nr:MAG: hypothetical protein M1834_006759 [Cirrosporium novae-zelandiae]
MGKFVLNGVDGNIGSVGADFALSIAKPGDELIFTTWKLDTIPAEKMKRWTDGGATVCYASYDDIPSMEKVFKDADAVTLISTWLIGDRRRKQMKTAIDTAKAVGVKRICYTSFVGADLETDLPVLPQDHRYTEQQIYASGLPWSIQRNNLYIDNVFQFFAPSWKISEDKWYSNSKGAPAAFVSRDDCGRVLGALLMGKGKPNTIYPVTGPETVSDHTLFDMVCKETNWKAEIVESTDDELYEYWGKKGVPRNMYGDFTNSPLPLCRDDLVSCGVVVRRGLMDNVSDSIEKLTGRKPETIYDVFPKYKDSLPKP